VFAEMAEKLDHIPAYMTKNLRNGYSEKLGDFHSLLNVEEFEKIKTKFLVEPNFGDLKSKFEETLNPVYLADMLFAFQSETWKTTAGTFSSTK
jgi:hypothetical protein